MHKQVASRCDKVFQVLLVLRRFALRFKTTLQCVAGNANAPFCPAVIGPIVVDEVASTSDGTLQSNQKGAQVSTLHRGMTITASSSSPDLPMRNPFKASTRTTNTCTSSPTQFSRRFQITNQLLYQLSYAGKKTCALYRTHADKQAAVNTAAMLPAAAFPPLVDQGPMVAQCGFNKISRLSRCTMCGFTSPAAARHSGKLNADGSTGVLEMLLTMGKILAMRMLLAFLLLPACALGANSVVNMSHYDLMRPDFAGMEEKASPASFTKRLSRVCERDAKYAERQRAALEAGLLWGAYHFGDGD